ncbi:leukotriene A-4 hydrolase, putative [Ricinus communis]|uniref:Leukotriene A-4 hydrolase, putative n=1 Tax=Ricinus communis TaxID=3988 RepID=B9SD59_RICCO|nr:leukotriene A-4 hydrolase, putative [Ricinus communis]
MLILGFTTYAERRVVEVVQGEDKAVLNIGIGWRGLNEEIERFKDNMEFTKLKTNQENGDPDDMYSQSTLRKTLTYNYESRVLASLQMHMNQFSNVYTKLVSLAHEFKLGTMPGEVEVAD